MRPSYWLAAIVAFAGLAAVVWAVLDPNDVAALGLFAGAVALPVAVLAAISGRTRTPVPFGSLFAGATIGPIAAVVGHVLVFAFAYAFFLGFADAAVDLLDAFRIDPSLVEVARSPWTLLVFFELVLFAPLVEETAKTVAAWVQRPGTRVGAFMAGVAAGVGFAVIENLVYAVGGATFGGPWEAIVTARALGAAVHPLATGLVALGWWEWRRNGDAGRLARRFLSGVGVHAVWNGSIVVLGIVGEAYGVDRLIGLGSLALVYAGGLGVVATGALWHLASTLREDEETSGAVIGADGRALGAWVVLASSMLVPIALLFLAYPDFVGG